MAYSLITELHFIVLGREKHNRKIVVNQFGFANQVLRKFVYNRADLSAKYVALR